MVLQFSQNWGIIMAKKTKLLSNKDNYFTATDGFDWNINGRKGNDTIFGAKGNDTLIGGKGDDRLEGNGGNNVLFGQDGNDDFHGGNGKATIYGGAGDDYIIASRKGSVMEGGRGGDELTGGKGKDTFVYKAGDSLTGPGQSDSIYRFQVGKDKIDLSSMTGANVVIVDAYGTNTLIRIDKDLDGTFDEGILVVNRTITENDLIL